MTDIFKAAAEGNIPTMKRLLKQDGHIANMQDEYGWTPLHFAASECQTEVVGMLLQHGAKVFARNADGHTPMHIVLQKKEEMPKVNFGPVLELLRKHASPLCSKCGEPFLTTKQVRGWDESAGRIDFDVLFCSDCGHIVAAR